MRMNRNDVGYIKYLLHIIGSDYGAFCQSEGLQALHETDFIGTVGHDDNREKDGKLLRARYFGGSEQDIDGISEPCTVLELMITLAEKMADMTVDGDDHGYLLRKFFWELYDNLLGECDNNDKYVTRKLVSNFVHRYYFPNGEGGLFPLKNSSADLREIELWYQMNAYLDEKYPIL